MNRVKKLFHYIFIPSENNNLRAKALHQDFLTVYLLLALIFVFFVKGVATRVSPNVLGFATDITTQKLYQLVNLQREENNLTDLHYNQELSTAAYNKAQDMFTKNYWAHYSPDGDTPWNFILASGYKYQYAGENLAKNFLFSQDVVNAWMQSPSHRENILRKEFHDVGFAVVNGVLNGEQTTLVIQMFGSPLSNTVVTKALPTNNQPASVKTLGKNAGAIVAQQQEASAKPIFNLFNLSLNATYLFIAFLTVVLLIDFYFAAKMGVVNFNGKNVAHLIFLLAIFIGLFFFLSKGAIL